MRACTSATEGRPSASGTLHRSAPHHIETSAGQIMQTPQLVVAACIAIHIGYWREAERAHYDYLHVGGRLHLHQFHQQK